MLIGRIERTGDFIEALLAEAEATRPRAWPGSTSDATRRRSDPRRCSPGTAKATSPGCAPGFADEYAIHDALLALAAERARAESAEPAA